MIPERDNSKDWELSSAYTGRKVLVTGGTGSIGRELTVQLLESSVKAVRVLSNDENGLFKMQLQFEGVRVRYLPGDVRDYERMKTAAKDIDYVFHAASLFRTYPGTSRYYNEGWANRRTCPP
jgi:FlaA1/EpsC-like NDP-sugar epimerase